MKILFAVSLFSLLNFSILGQGEVLNPYDVSADYPFGQLNPEAPEQISDWAPLIGECNCRSEQRNPDGTWAEPTEMLWRFKYIMNGQAVQDETFKSDGSHSGSLRFYNPDSL